MRDRRTEIVAALNKLLVRQRYVDVQILGLHVARTKWPELEATESRSDGGEDGTSFVASSDGMKRILACSATATLAKIRADAGRLRERGIRPDVLVFLTPQPVINTLVGEWREAVREEFGHDLHVIGQAEIVLTLENPLFNWISRECLDLDFSDQPDPARDEADARRVATAVLDGFKRFHGYDAVRQVDLTLLRRAGAPAPRAPEAVSLTQAMAALASRRPVVFTGLPGAGKTITLLRLAELTLADQAQPIPLVVSIPGWLAGTDDLLTYASETFAAYGLPADRACQLLAQGKIALLLNGWNETAEGGAARASALIRDFVTKFPGTPLALSTRHTRNPQPLGEELQFEVQPLSAEQKSRIIRSHSLADPDRFFRLLRENRSLARLTNTPLFLSAAIGLANSGEPIPAARSALLASLVSTFERSPEHRAALEAGPCQGHHRRFSEDLASAMTNGGMFLSRDAVLREVIRIGRSLQAERLCDPPPNPIGVLDSLVQHHLLVLAPGPAQLYGFGHQQVQEWLAAQALARSVLTLVRDPASVALNQFATQVLDQPRWHEALGLMIEDLVAAQKPEVITEVIRWTLPVDLILSAELAGAADDASWALIQPFLSPALREWHSLPLAAARECALTAILATGRPDFADLLWPSIEGSHDQQAYTPFRMVFPIGTKSLGAEMHQRFSRLDLRRQTLVIGELCRNGGPSEAAFARALAQATPHPAVKLAALEALISLGERQAAAEIVAAQREAWSEGIYRHVLAYLPDTEAEQFRDRARREFAQTSELRLRRAALGLLARLKEPGWLESAKNGIADVLAARSARSVDETLRAGPVDPNLDLLNEYVILIQRGDPVWLQNWAVENGATDLIWQRPLVDLVPNLPEPLLLRLLAALGPHLDLTGQRNRLSLLAATGAPRVLAEMLRLSLSAEGSCSSAIEFSLKDAPLGPLISAIAATTPELTDSKQVNTLLRLVGPHSPLDLSLRSGTTPEQRRSLRTIVLSVAGGLNDPVEHRSERAYLAVFLGAVGEPSDVGLVSAWLFGERDHWLELRREWAESRAVRPYRPQGRRDITSWWNWYVGALVQLQCPESERLLIELLGSPLTLADAAGALAQLSVLEGAIPSEPGYHHGAWAELPPQSRLASPPSSAVVQNRAEAIHAAILRARNEPPGDVPIFADLPAAIAALGFLGDPRTLPLMIEVTRGSDSTGGLVNLYYSLALRGVQFPAAAALDAMEPFVAKHERPIYGGGDQWYSVCRALAVLLFSADPAVGIERIRRLPEERMRSHDAREIFAIVARCPATVAADFLLEQSTSPDAPVRTEVLEALAAHHDPRCHARLAEILAAPPAARRHRADYQIQHLSLQLAHEDKGFRVALTQGLSALPRGSLSPLQAGLLVELATPEAFLALLAHFPGDHAAMERALHDVVLEKIPLGSASTYYLAPHPRAELKRRLFAIYLSDDSTRAGAYAALTFLRKLRAEHGLHPDEPLHPDITRLAALDRPWPLAFPGAVPSVSATPNDV
jgi:hypothetical protein